MLKVWKIINTISEVSSMDAIFSPVTQQEVTSLYYETPALLMHPFNKSNSNGFDGSEAFALALTNANLYLYEVFSIPT